MAAKKTTANAPAVQKIGKLVDMNFAKCQIEALLFASGKTISEEQLALLSKLELSTVKKSLALLQQEYVDRNSAIILYNDPNGWRLMVKEQYIGTVKNIVADTELSRACMETLAIIAYKYPKVLQSEVIEIRGSGAYEHMAELEHLGFIKRDPQGRSYAVKLTDKFFSYFEVKGGQDIRDVFKNIKPKPKTTEPTTKQKTLGDLEVVDAQADTKQTLESKKFDGLEVVDTDGTGSPIQNNHQSNQSTQSSSQSSDSFEQGTGRFEQAPEEIEIHNAFLDDLDRRIARITERNTNNEQDESLRRKPLPGSEQLNTDSTESSESAEPNDVEGTDSEHEKENK